MKEKRQYSIAHRKLHFIGHPASGYVILKLLDFRVYTRVHTVNAIITWATRAALAVARYLYIYYK